MERAISFQCSPDEFSEFIKNAVRDVLGELHKDTSATSPPVDVTVLTSNEVCKLLHISLPTLQKYRECGAIKAKLIRGKYFYLKTEIEKALTAFKKN